MTNCDTTSALLDAWDQGARGSETGRALALLSAAYPDETADALARLPLGERDRRLLALREALFGPQLTGVAACPACAERLEIALSVGDIRSEPALAGRQDGDAADERVFAFDGHEIGYRLPDSTDLEAAGGCADVETARRALAERCVLRAVAQGQPVAVADLPPVLLEGLAAAMAQADPQAEVELALTCPACGHEWVAPFDIAAFLWAEVDDWAKRLLRDVHTLASAYGWREADILALSPWRRQAYLALIAGSGM